MNPDQEQQIGRAIFREANDAFLIVQPADLRVVEANPALQRLTGFRRKQVIGMVLADVLEAEIPRCLEDVIRACQTTSYLTASDGYFLKTQNGSSVPVHVTAGRIHLEPEPLALLVIRDISERKRAHEKLRESEQQFRELFENSPTAIFVKDLNGRVLNANSAACRLHNMERTELVGKQMLDLIPPDRRGEAAAVFSKLALGEVSEFEGFIWTQDQRTIPVELRVRRIDYSGQPALLLHARDITERKRDEEAMRSSEQRFRKLAEEVRLIAWEADARTWAFTYVSPYAVELLGYPQEAWSGATFWADHIHADDRERSIRYCAECSRTLDNYEFEYRMVAADGRTVWLRDIVNVMRDETGPKTLRGFLIDITDRKRAQRREQSRRDILQQIATGQRLPAILESIVAFVERESPESRCSILLLDKSRRHLLHGAAPRLPDFYNQAIHGLEIGPTVGSCGTAAFSNQRVIVEDIETHPYWTPYRDLARRAGLRSCWSDPIVSSSGEVVGTFAVYHAKPQTPTEDELDAIALSTHLAGIAIERMRAEEALRDSQHMLRVVLDNIPQGVFWKDRQSRYLGCNRVVARAFGLEVSEEIIGKDDRHLPGLTGEQADFFVSKDRQVMSSDAPELGIIEPATLADGTSIWIETNKIPMHDAAGQVVGILGTWQDITERKQAEKALQLERARYHHIFEYSPIAIWEEDFTDLVAWLDQLRQRGITDLLAYLSAHPEEVQHALSLVRVIDVNQAALIQNAAQTKEQLLQHLPALFTDATLTTFLAELEGVWQGKTSIEFESSSRRLDGRRLDVIVHIDVACEEGRPDWSRAIVTATDITERKRAEEERRQLEAQIQHAQKLESLGVLAGGIAHDFNNLLTGIVGYASLALMQLPEESPACPMLREIEIGGWRAAELTQQMLAYSGRGKFVIQALRLDVLVQEMTKFLRTVVSKKAALSLNLEPATIEGDATQIRQVVMNLIINASDALEDHDGVICVRTGIRQADSTFLRTPYLAAELPAGAYAYVEVEDSGCGMTEATMASIFDPFFTTKFTGRGLGLAAVLGIVKGHRGTIKVDSTPGQGTVFQVLLPCFSGAPTEGVDAGPGVSIWRGQGTVLVVDDEASIRTFSRDVLERVGFQVREAGDGREGLDLFGRHRQEIVAVLLDLTMPRMDGKETLVEMRRLDAAVPVVVMSGYSESETSMRFAGMGANGFIQKPFHPRDLVARICQLLPSAVTTDGR